MMASAWLRSSVKPHNRVGVNCMVRPLKIFYSKATGSLDVVGRRVVRLHQFIKKSEKTPLNDLKSDGSE